MYAHGAPHFAAGSNAKSLQTGVNGLMFAFAMRDKFTQNLIIFYILD